MLRHPHIDMYVWVHTKRHVNKGFWDPRYQLLPYHYSLAHRLTATGALYVRPLVAEFPEVGTTPASITRK